MSSLTLNSTRIPTGLYIDGAWVAGHGEPLETVNPATEELLGRFDTASHSDVDLAVAAARRAFETSWGTNVAAAERGRLVYALADKLEQAAERIAHVESLDSGKPRAWCVADNADAVACLRYYAGESHETRPPAQPSARVDADLWALHLLRWQASPTRSRARQSSSTTAQSTSSPAASQLASPPRSCPGSVQSGLAALEDARRKADPCMFLIVASLVELPDAHDGLGALRWRAVPPSVL
jgi:hypothetical protein